MNMGSRNKKFQTIMVFFSWGGLGGAEVGVRVDVRSKPKVSFKMFL